MVQNDNVHSTDSSPSYGTFSFQLCDSVPPTCLRRSSRTNCPAADGTTVADENMMAKAMRRTAEKN